MNERENRLYTQAQGIGLKEYVDNEFKMCREIRATRLAAMDKALEMAHDTMETRLTGMNEFRETLRDQASKFITRNELLAVVVGASTIISAVVSLIVFLLAKRI